MHRRWVKNQTHLAALVRAIKDQGGTGKVTLVATVGEPLTVQRPQPLWSEQAPGEWWAATERAMQRLKAEHGAALAQVRAIGLSGQMHGAVLLDAQDRVLRPAILWNDTRCALECTEMMAELPSLPALAGSLAMPGFTAYKVQAPVQPVRTVHIGMCRWAEHGGVALCGAGKAVRSRVARVIGLGFHYAATDAIH